MIASRRIKKFEIGDFVIERSVTRKKRRVGEVVFVREGRRRKLQLLQLKIHDLTPISSGDLRSLKFFTLGEEKCRKLNLFKYKKRKTFRIGDIIRHSRHGHIRFGQIVGFIHPDGLYSKSAEEGYNGKDLIECIELSGRVGLPRKYNAEGHLKRFMVGPKHSKICEILPMDKEGGVRIKDYWELKSKTMTR